jgi:tetratricopeptide (TPR) repeat protein
MDDDQKIAELSEAIRLNPNNATAYSKRGVVYANNKDYDRAVADFTEAVRLNPNNARGYYSRGVVYANKRDFDRAVVDLTEAVRLDPNNAASAASLEKVKALAQKAAEQKETVRLNPNDATSAAALAKAATQNVAEQKETAALEEAKARAEKARAEAKTRATAEWRVAAAQAAAQKAAEQKETVLISKIVLRVVRVACLVVVACFFSGYFIVSCQGAEISISGVEAAFGIDKEYIPLDPAPLVLLIPVVALVVLIALSVPSVRKKREGVKLSPARLSVAGGAIGLLLLAIVHYAAIGKVKEGLGGYDISSVYHTGFGFKTSVFAYIVMLVMPLADKISVLKLIVRLVTPVTDKMLNKNAPSAYPPLKESKKCKRCGKSVDSGYTACPHCGASDFE